MIEKTLILIQHNLIPHLFFAFAVLGIYFYENLITILSFVFVGYVFLITIILAKYAAYPDKMNIIQGVLIAFSIYLPPMLVFVIPYFYFQSLKQLKPLLK